MIGLLFFVVLSVFQMETVRVDTTFVLPPLAEAVITKNELKLPPEIPNLVPKEIKKDIPKAFLKDLNRRLFSLYRTSLSAKSISRTPQGKLVTIDSTGINIYSPPFFYKDTLKKDLSEAKNPYSLDFNPTKNLTLFGTEDGKLIIRKGNKTDTLTDFKGPVSTIFCEKHIFATDQKGIYKIKKSFGKWKKKEILKGHFEIFAAKKKHRFYVLAEDGSVREFSPEKSPHLGKTIVKLPKGTHSPLLLDATLDGTNDLLFVQGGKVLYYPGLPNDRFLKPDTTNFVIFKEKFPFTPSFDFFKNGRMALATEDGKLFEVKIEKGPNGFKVSKELLFKLKVKETGDPFPVLRIFDYNNDQKEDIVIGTKSGKIYVFKGPNFKEKEMISFPYSYSAPTFLHKKIIAGSMDGKIYDVKTQKTISNIPVLDSGSVFPYAKDITGDGKDELFVGTQSGKVYLLTQKDETWVIDSSFEIDVGEMAIPSLFDFDHDGDLDLFVSNADGKIFYFENQTEGKRANFIEKYTWDFIPSGRDSTFSTYYNRVYLPLWGFEFKVMGDSSSFSKFLNLLKRTPKNLKDEVAFTIFHTPTEVLRAMAHLDEEGILLENAKDILKADSLLPYAKIIELDGGLSTVVYDEKDTLPSEIYYKFMVHPRILFEIPAKVNTDYWKRDSSYYGISRDEWLKHEEDIYNTKRGGQFWRTVFLRDSAYGKSPVDVVKLCKTEREAVESLYVFQGPEAGGFMKFGYKTQDIQPLQIYQKAYGSCGEQSILFCALARTLLIPTCVVIDLGEDHQWNEFWGKGAWHHLDVNWKLDNGIDHPATSVMKKPITAVVGWEPLDIHFTDTKRYVDTSTINLKIIDGKGNPIPGALITARSHWKDRNLIGYWTYSDTRGIARLGIGYQPKGYTLEILTPSGAAGAQNIFFQTGKEYRISYSVPHSFPLGLNPLEASIKKFNLNIERIKAYTLRNNLITSVPYRISSKTLKDVGYIGTKLERFPIGEGYLSVFDEGESLILKNPFPLTEEEVSLSIFREDTMKKPEISLSAQDSVTSGGKIEIKGWIKDNLGISTAGLEIRRGDSIVRKIYLTRHLNFKNPEEIFKKEASFSFKLETGRGGPLTPGIYSLIPIAKDLSGNVSYGKTVNFQVKPTKEYKDQLVYQDNPEDTLPSASWIMHFFVKEPLRFLLFETNAPDAKGLDLDIFLYRDQNGDGKPEKKELVKSSTSPTNRERIFISLPEEGEYWFYAQGCTVRTPPQPFDLKTSFFIDEKEKASE